MAECTWSKTRPKTWSKTSAFYINHHSLKKKSSKKGRGGGIAATDLFSTFVDKGPVTR